MKPWPFLLLCALLGCTNAPRPNAITRIVLSRNACDPQCSFAQYAIYPDGRVDYNNGLRYQVKARMPLQSYRAIVAWLVRTPAFGPRWDYGGAPVQQPSTTIWTDYGGRYAQVSFPTQGLAQSSDPNVRALDKWASFAAAQAQWSVMRERRNGVARRRRFENLQSVIFTRIACYGTCPAYTAQFDAHGTATLRNVHFFLGATAERAVNCRARIPFGKVIDLLRASAFANLDPEYPVHAVDVPGASFEFRYRDGYSFAVLAPDETQWPPEVAQLVGAFSQLIRDTSWQVGPQ